MTPAEVQCATSCYAGCHCAAGLFLLNGSCVPQARCPCYHQGALHPPGASLPADACNSWWVVVCGCGWVGGWVGVCVCVCVCVS